MSKRLTFDEFWNIAERGLKNYNPLTYHPCCDTWSTRKSRKTIETHTKKIKWYNLFTFPNLNIEEKKKLLLSKMTEESWQIPVILNRPCQPQPTPNLNRTDLSKLCFPVPQHTSPQVPANSQGFILSRQMPCDQEPNYS